MQANPQLTLYIYHHSGNWNGQYGERYTVFDETGTPLANGLGQQKSLALQLEIELPEGPALFKSHLRKTFAFNGKIDVIHPDGSTLAIVTRSRKVLDPEENELFRLADPTSRKENLTASLIDGIGNALLGDGSDASTGNASSHHLLLKGESAIGSLTRKPLPFFPEPPSQPGAIQNLVYKFLPKRFSERKPPLAWHLRYTPADSPAIPSPVLINTTTLLAELIRWGS